MSKLKLPTKDSILLILFSLIAALYGASQSYRAPIGYENLWLLPLFYAILLSLTNVRKVFFKYLGISLLNIILFVRYVIIPFFSSITGLYGHSSIRFESRGINSTTILVLLYEMICLFVVLHFCTKKLDRIKKAQSVSLFDVRKSNDFYLVAGFVGVLSMIIFPAIRARINFLIVNEFDFINLNTLSSIGFLFASNAPRFFFLWIVVRELNRRLNKKNPNNFLVFLFAFISISLVFSNSRLTILAQGLAAIFILKDTKLVSTSSLKIMGAITAVIIISLTSLRLFGYGSLSGLNENVTSYFDFQVVSDNLQAYFGGHHLISAAVSISPKFPSHISNLLNESLSSILFVRQIYPLDINSSTVHFNKLFGFFQGNSMILPTLGQGYMYFGILGAPLISIGLSLLLFISEKKLLKATNVGEKFSFLLLTIWLAFFPMQNLNIVTATIFNIFLPLYGVVLINNRKFTFFRKISKIKGIRA